MIDTSAMFSQHQQLVQTLDCQKVWYIVSSDLPKHVYTLGGMCSITVDTAGQGLAAFNIQKYLAGFPALNTH